MTTSFGVETTARNAHDHGYHIAFAVDAVTDLDTDSHEHSTRALFPRIGETGTTAEILDLLLARR